MNCCELTVCYSLKYNTLTSRSKAQSRVDQGEDQLHETRAMDLSGLGAQRVTSRIYDLVELQYLNLSDNRLTRISPNIQYFSV